MGRHVKKDERFWWAVLVRANEQMTSECCRTPPDMDAWLLAHRVGLEARTKLVELDINLDEVFPAADDEFLRLLEVEKQAEAARKHDVAQGIVTIDKIDALLKEHEVSRT